MIMKFFTKHLKEVNETYFAHMKYALLISARMQIATYAQILHAIFPFIRPPLGGDVESMGEFLNNQKTRRNKDE